MCCQLCGSLLAAVVILGLIGLQSVPVFSLAEFAWLLGLARCVGDISG